MFRIIAPVLPAWLQLFPLIMLYKEIINLSNKEVITLSKTLIYIQLIK